jgi:hypothetical protein
MDVFDEDLLNFWRSLSQNKVEYIMIGGFAVNMHGFTRATMDIDVWLKDDVVNRMKFGNVLKDYGYDGVAWDTIQFVPGWTDFQIASGLALDIITKMVGLDITFTEAYNLATIAEIQDVKVPFLHINHLIQNKKAVNRPKDQIDVQELEKIARLKKDSGL